MKCWLHDAARFGLFSVATAGYVALLPVYLGGLKTPGLLIGVFAGTWLLALRHDVKTSCWREGLAAATTTTLVFLLGVLVAHAVHQAYAGLVVEFARTPELREVIGADYYDAMMNRTVGYGSCFGAGVMLTRWLLQRPLSWLLTHKVLGLAPA